MSDYSDDKKYTLKYIITCCIHNKNYKYLLVFLPAKKRTTRSEESETSIGSMPQFRKEASLEFLFGL